MAKRKSFEEILNREFRWPRQGDRPFVVAGASSDNAEIENDGFARLVLMMEGYKKAADLMIEASTGGRYTRDILVFPIIFSYRQFIELSLKFHLATYGPSVGIEPNWRSHDLEELWTAFMTMLDEYGTVDPDEVDPVVAEIILEFAKIDPASYAYRYPVDRQGNPLQIAYSEFHLPTLADVMNGVAGYFTGCDGYLHSMSSEQAES